jgi:hypothetical protein
LVRLCSTKGLWGILARYRRNRGRTDAGVAHSGRPPQQIVHSRRKNRPPESQRRLCAIVYIGRKIGGQVPCL